MAMRRNPRRKCRTQQTTLPIVSVKTSTATSVSPKSTWNDRNGHEEKNKCRRVHLATAKIRRSNTGSLDQHRFLLNPPFPFFQLPREIRDQVYSYLVISRSSNSESILEAATILKNRKKRVSAQTARDRLTRQRLISGKPPISTRMTPTSEPVVHLDLLQASQRTYCEASDCLYNSNWFAVSLSKLPSTAVETPVGWDLSRIRRLKLELQLKDSPRMNSYIDWTAFFFTFSALRVLHILPTFHPRYYDWAQTELCDWRTTHYVHKAFFRELLAAIPSHVDLRLGYSSGATDRFEFHGRLPVGQTVLEDMYTELGSRNQHCRKMS
ncbi:Nn.00g089890.m01.CDS01 [Neocucurbitaria sp. VM-36]